MSFVEVASYPRNDGSFDGLFVRNGEVALVIAVDTVLIQLAVRNRQFAFSNRRSE